MGIPLYYLVVLEALHTPPLGLHPSPPLFDLLFHHPLLLTLLLLYFFHFWKLAVFVSDLATADLLEDGLVYLLGDHALEVRVVFQNMGVHIRSALSLAPPAVFEVLVLPLREDGLPWNVTQSLQDLVGHLTLLEVHLEVVQVLQTVLLLLLLPELVQQQTDGLVLIPEVQVIVDYVGAFTVHQERVAPVVVQSIFVQGVLSVHFHTQLFCTTYFIDVTLGQFYLVATLHLEEHPLHLALSLLLGLTAFLLVELDDVGIGVLATLLSGHPQVLHIGLE